MTSENKKRLAIAAAIVVSFAVGRFTTPEKVKIETKVVTVEVKVKEKDKHKETKIVEVTKPDGTKEKTKTIIEDTKTNIVKESSQSAETKTERIGSTQRTTISGLIGIDFNNLSRSPVVYGGSVSRPIIGPVTLGAWGLSNLTFGASVGVQF